MAVYWVDPYIEASVGGIHGTTDTTSRSGTYAAPWALSDMYATSTNGNTNLSGLSDGDEIRFKGLAKSSYLIDAGSDFYVNGNNISKASSHTSAVTSAISSWGNTALIVMYDTVATDKFTVADSDGNKPLIFQSVSVSSTTSPSNQFSSPTSGHYVLHYGPLRAEGTSTATASLQMYLVDPQYYIPNSQTGNLYFCQYNNIGIKVTDGWTSSTARDGYTILPIFKSSPTTTTRYYYNTTTGSSTGPDTLYDMPNTFFAYHNSVGQTYTYGYHYVCSATGGYHAGYTYTHRIGGISANGSSAARLLDYTGNYYYNAVSSTDPLAVNGFEVGITMFYYYGIQTYKYYGSNTASEYTTQRYNNSFTYYYSYTLSSANKAANYYLGTHMHYYIFDRFLIDTSNTTFTTDINLLAGAYFYKPQSGGGQLFEPTSATYNINILGTIYNYDGPALSSRTANSGEGPQYLFEVDAATPYKSNPKLNPTSWTDGVTAAYTTGFTSVPINTSITCSMGVLDVGSDDYTTGSCKFLIGSNLDINEYWENSGKKQTNLIFHTNSNTSDGLPIGMAISSDKTNAMHPPMLYFNDPNKSDALCFVSNDQADNVDYVQSLEIPITATGAYTSSDTIRLKARLETSSNWSSTSYIIGAWYYNTSNEPTWQAIQSGSAALTTATDYTYDLAASSLYDAGNNYRFLRFTIQIANKNTVSQKLWIHELSATVV